MPPGDEEEQDDLQAQGAGVQVEDEQDEATGGGDAGETPEQRRSRSQERIRELNAAKKAAEDRAAAAEAALATTQRNQQQAWFESQEGQAWLRSPEGQAEQIRRWGKIHVPADDPLAADPRLLAVAATDRATMNGQVELDMRDALTDAISSGSLPGYKPEDRRRVLDAMRRTGGSPASAYFFLFPDRATKAAKESAGSRVAGKLATLDKSATPSLGDRGAPGGASKTTESAAPRRSDQAELGAWMLGLKPSQSED